MSAVPLTHEQQLIFLQRRDDLAVVIRALYNTWDRKKQDISRHLGGLIETAERAYDPKNPYAECPITQDSMERILSEAYHALSPEDNGSMAILQQALSAMHLTLLPKNRDQNRGSQR